MVTDKPFISEGVFSAIMSTICGDDYNPARYTRESDFVSTPYYNVNDWWNIPLSQRYANFKRALTRDKQYYRD